MRFTYGQLLRNQAKRLLTGKKKAKTEPTRLALESLEAREVPANVLSPGAEAAFVQSLYTEVLGRAGTPQEESGWVSDLQNGRSVESVASSFLSSSEYYSHRVDELYHEVLHRPADAVGVNNFVTVLQHGGSEHEVLTSLFGSAEYNTAHADNADFVHSLYSDVLHRDNSPAELTHYLGLLADGRSRADITQGFLTSPERAQDEVNALYQRYLGRDADAGSLTNFAEALLGGRASLGQLAVTLAASEENQGQALPPDTTAPTITGVTSVSPTAVRVTFSEDMAENALNPALYRISQAGTGLQVKSVSFVGNEKRTVELTTEPQADGSYILAVSGAADLASNATTAAEIGFSGTPSPLDSDADGLRDFVERRGWDVTVINADGTKATRHVTSDPFKVDTDGDGLTDAQERAAGLDPRAADTDADGLSDQAEGLGWTVNATLPDGTTVTRKVTSNPLNADTDADGLADALEFDHLSDPRAADTDADGLNDAMEVTGWDVTVTNVDGTTATRHVASDPTKADTDADGLTDIKERGTGTDPTSADTDADGLSDKAEITARTVTFTKANGTTATRSVTSDPTKQDTDDDGLTDAEEAAAGLDPRAADTDADGLSDTAEGLGWTVNAKLPDGTTVTRDVTSDPLKADTDGDGLADGLEFDHLSDPRIADTDADGLADSTEVAGWDVTVTKADGTTATRHVSSDPTKADTDGDGILDVIERASHLDPTTADTDVDGIDDAAEQAGWTVTFYLADGTAVVRNVTSDPLKADTDADGLIDGREFAAATDPRDTDTDDDDATDAEEVDGWQVTVRKVNGTTTTRAVTSDPLRPDTDGDGLTDRHELGLKTDPRNTDTDGDGLTDYQEVIQIRSKPADQDSDGDGVDDGTEYNVLHTPVNTPPSNPDNTNPGVAGAVSLGNTSLLVSFTEAVSDRAIDKANYYVTKSINGSETLALGIKSISFLNDTDRTTVVLETTSQDEGTYTVTAVNLQDFSGNALAPIRGTFAGSPRTGVPLDSDGDLVPDVVEQRGWRVVVKMLDGRTEERWVTSDPLSKDTDGDGLDDRQELAFSLDPRNWDTDADTLNDALEVNIIGSNASSQDTDGDGKGDATEYAAGGADDVLNKPAVAPPADTTPPRVVGAASFSNTTVLVSFSEAVSEDNALNPSHYFIVQQNVNGEVGYVPIVSVAFNSADHRSVLLTTASQNEVTYSVTAVNVTDVAGNALAPAVLAGGQRIDPATAVFPGTPASGANLVDSDGDGLPDSVEVRGYTVTVTLLNGTTVSRQVTSDPNNADTDGDGLNDAQEYNIGTDPRSADTDGDQLNDYAEFNEVYTDPTNQDTDGDSLDDFLEFTFFHTSPFFADTDGDQISDADEVYGNRNPLVSDLPRPEISVGEINLQLDVHFTETNDQQRRDLETQSISTTLTNSESKTFTKQHTANVEAHLEGGYGDGSATGGGFFKAGASAGYTYQQTDESANASEQAYEKSLSTDKEVTRGFTVQREVTGAVMQVAVSLRNLSNLAYRVQNIQVTAFIQDPLDHTKLTPVATLLPDSEPADGFTLGPLVTSRGPIIFSNTTIVPKLVESLIANASGLIFRISNYDIIDEAGRNFAFTSQSVVERTGQLVVDFGGARSLRAKVGGDPIDENLPGDETEIYRVATSGGRPIADTNGDGKVDVAPRELFDSRGNSLGIDANGDGAITAADATYVRDTAVIFDGAGKEVGISLYQALAAAGLKHYDEATTPTGNLNQTQILGSYSTYFDVASNREKIYRIRGVGNDALNQKYWEILTADGIDQVTDLNDLILKAGSGISLNFVQDLDGDGLPADVEFFLGTSDSPTPAGTAVPSSTNTTGDTVTFSTDPKFATGNLVHVSADGGGLKANANYFIRNLGGGSYSFYNSQAAALAGGTAGRLDLTAKITAIVGVPAGRDTDKDGLDDRFEALIGWTVTTPQRTYQVYSSPNRADSNFDAPTRGADNNGNGIEDRTEYDSSDTFAAPAGWTDTNSNGLRDRFEVFQAGPTDYVLDPLRKDTDGDGLSDATEIIGFKIVRITDGSVFVRKTNPLSTDTDGDTFSDGFEKQVGLDPTDGNDVDTDGDGLPDPVEQAGWNVRTVGVSTSPYVDGAVKNLVWTSDINSVDSDGDGLTDFEEFFLKTNPRAADTDNDGISDLLELKGYTLPHDVGGNNLGIITTNPLDADTDNDKRSDGAEAELKDVEQARWVVRVVGQTPYRAYSNPLVADADFDGLVDGDEFAFGSDPNNGNTDGDSRDDGKEFTAHTNPLVEDFQVTVFITSLTITQDGGRWRQPRRLRIRFWYPQAG